MIGVLVYFSVWGMFIVLDKYFSKHEAPPSPMMVEQKATTPTRAVPEGYVEKIFPEPRLETNERTEINDFRLGEEQTLNSYGWVDQNAGVVRIPITKAMELIAQRGLPTRPAAGIMSASRMAAPNRSGRHQGGQRLRPAEWSRSRSGLPKTRRPPCHPATPKISTSAAASLISTRGANGNRGVSVDQGARSHGVIRRSTSTRWGR